MSNKPDFGLTRWIQAGLLILVAVMPFHAFLSVVLGHYFGHQAQIQAWKEVLTLLLGLLTAGLVIRQPERLARLRKRWVYAAVGFAAVAIIVTAFTGQALTAMAFGVKTDLEFLLIGLIALLVASADFTRKLFLIVLIGSAGVIAFGLVQAYLLPPDFLAQFGYGAATIAPYQHINGGSLRFPSTLGGPNQLGTYLILPICLSFTMFVRHRKGWLLVLPIAGLTVLIHTFSRSAWLGAAAAIIFTLVFTLPRKYRTGLLSGLAILAAAAIILLPAALNTHSPLRDYLLHSGAQPSDINNSDSQHAISLRQGKQADLAAPLGHGLGTAGPATFHAGHGNIIENYYLQLGYETGILGAVLFIVLIGALVLELMTRAKTIAGAVPAAAAVIGVCLAGIFLPAWTDSSTALIVFCVAGAISGLIKEPGHVETK